MAADLRLVADAAERHADELAVERAGDRLADRRLAGAGRPDQGEDRARLLVGLDAPLLTELAHRDVLDDAVLDVLETGVVGVEHLAAGLRVEPLLGADAPRHGQEPVHVAADRLRLGRALPHALEAGKLTLCLLAHVVGHRRLGDLGPELLDDGRLVLAELLLDRLELLAQDVLPLLVLHAGVDVLADAAPDLHQRQALPLERERELEPLGNVDGLEHLHLLLEGQVGRVAGRVGERAGVGDGTDEGCDAAVVAAQLEDLLDHGAVFGFERADGLAGRLLVRALVGLDEEAATGVGLGRTGNRPVEAVQGHGGAAARQPDRFGDLSDGADLGVLALVLGHEQHALLVTDVDRQGHIHVREDDDVVEWDEQELAHSRFTLLGSFNGVGHTSTNYKNCTGIPEGRAWPRQNRTLTERVQTLARASESHFLEPG